MKTRTVSILLAGDHVQLSVLTLTIADPHIRSGAINTKLHSKIERGAQAMANGGVLKVRRSETGRRQRSYMNEGDLV